MDKKPITPKVKKPKNYEMRDAPPTVVSEPVMTYKQASDPATTRTIGLMGMGGRREFAGIRNETDFISVIRTGIPKQAMTHLMDVADITLTEMAAIVHTSDRTLRRYSDHEKLSPEQSERMVEMARVYSRGEEVLGSMEHFRKWMDAVLLPFGNKKPREFLDTSLGIEMIMNELGRIEYGILA
jgi:putative toxin-antitoxin system antitoxin component (TIGR02293 family)